MLLQTPSVDPSNTITSYIENPIARYGSSVVRVIGIVGIEISNECWGFGFELTTKCKNPILCCVQVLEDA